MANIKLQDKKRYLIIIEQEKNQYVFRLAYWFNERKETRWVYETGFYRTRYWYFPYKNVVGCMNIPDYLSWKLEEPIEGEKYLVYRVNSYDSHYAIRKFHNGSFRNNDIEYWIRLSDVFGEEKED